MKPDSHSSGSQPSAGWTPPTPQELQKALPKYEITSLLGSGGMGAVYKGKQTSLDRAVAIKILSTALKDVDPSFAERFKVEARAMGQLSHPGIISVHDFGETDDGLLYIVMEYVGGTDVAQMIHQQGRLQPDHAIAITAHVCDAMAYAHSKGILHRDIKPANVMVGYDGVVKIADFGLAKMNTDVSSAGLTQSGMAMGTMHYMAPECFSGAAAADHRADIYAVGVMFYQMLTGKLPRGVFDWPSQQINGLDARYDAVIAKSIRENQEDRYQNATELRRDLDQVLSKPVVKVAAGKEGPAPAALPTMARPKRSPSGGSRVKPPQGQPRAPQQVPQKSKSRMLPIAIGAAVVIGLAAFLFQPANTVAPAEAGLPSTDAVVPSAPAEPKPVDPNAWPTGPHFRSFGRFRAWSSEPNSPAIDLKTLGRLSSIKQLYMHQNGWVVLREDGIIMANARGVNGTKGIKKICPGFGDNFALISEEGKLIIAGTKTNDPKRQPPADLGPVADAYTSPFFHVALQEDGKLVVWGDGFDGVKAVGNPEWKTKPALEKGQKAVAFSASDLSLAVRLQDDSLRVWHLDIGELTVPSEIKGIKAKDFAINRNHLYIAPADGGPVISWPLDRQKPRGTLPNKEIASELFETNRDLLALDPNGKPFGNPGFISAAPAVSEVLARIPKAKPGLISAFVKVSPPAVTHLLWFDDSANATAEATTPSAGDWPADNAFFRRIGNFKVWSSEPNRPAFGSLSKLQGIDDAIQVYEGGGVWLVLRANGETISNNPEAVRKNIARIGQGQSNFIAFIDREGNFDSWVPDVDRFPDRKAPANLKATDSALSPTSNFVLTPDGQLALYGKAFDGIDAPPENLEWKAQPAVPTGRRAIAISHEESHLALLLDDRTTLLWKPSGPITLPSSLVRQTFRQVETTSDRFFGILENGQPIVWKLSAKEPSIVPGLARAASVHDAGRGAIYFLDPDGKPHFPEPDGAGTLAVLEPLLPYIRGARPDLFSVRLDIIDKEKRTVAALIWYDAPTSPTAPIVASQNAAPSTAAPTTSKPTLDFPDFNTRLANYRTARRDQLTALYVRYRDALGEERDRERNAGGLPNIEHHNTAIANATMLPTAIDATTKAAAPRPLPALGLPNPNAPKRLHELREILVKEIIRTDYALVAALDQSLATVQGSLVKENDLATAKLVETYRKEMMAAFPKPEEERGAPVVVAATKPTPTTAPAASSAASSSPAAATKERPYVNALGMKFVPVPGTKVLFCMHETRLGDFKQYASTVPGIHQHWRKAYWAKQSVSREDNYPVVAVTRMDAEGFCKWITEKTGIPHRLPTDEEWSRAVGIGHKEGRRSSTTPQDLERDPLPDYPWGSSFPPPSPAPENLRDEAYGNVMPGEEVIADYNDGFVTTAPVMSLQPNDLGIYDLGGNVAEWVSDWYGPDKQKGTFRGARFTTSKANRAVSSVRQGVVPDDLRFSADRGFRVVIELP
jgi:serine/threonine protein kinase